MHTKVSKKVQPNKPQNKDIPVFYFYQYDPSSEPTLNGIAEKTILQQKDSDLSKKIGCPKSMLFSFPIEQPKSNKLMKTKKMVHKNPLTPNKNRNLKPANSQHQRTRHKETVIQENLGFIPSIGHGVDKVYLEPAVTMERSADYLYPFYSSNNAQTFFTTSNNCTEQANEIYTEELDLTDEEIQRFFNEL